ncbi:uncharacterized protein EV420DRAFT_1648380 [Desarmillaria tabescens]|uniref:Glycoside hydrolase family 76 protein n=1 Tax=Armillaria tabescens TaxID=1929756 RepID=A0AA39JN88_ARMTA|nr:uncharacterized protein EV420DRAFT_1648380 [Desarmillaria tabescens]KAK0445664.1 hypothetical protein EV420DRAFT_1648380 [Desarmillaria tabescens]
MAEFDRLTNQTKYKEVLKQFFKFAESVHSNFLSNPYALTVSSGLLLTDLDSKSLYCGLNYGYAAAQAYTVYPDTDFLNLAVTLWTSVRKYMISDEKAASGTTEVKNFNLSSSCLGVTLEGGTFLTSDSNDPILTSLASGFVFFLFYHYLMANSENSASFFVSALLAEATSNQTYLDAAIKLANFIQMHLLDSSNIIAMSSQLNESCSVDLTACPYNSGIFIEGLVVLADITHNASTKALLSSTISNVTTYPQWQGLDGVITTETTGGLYIVWALAALYECNMTSSDLREYIKEYIAYFTLVQYNAVINQTTSGGSNIYGLPWTGAQSTLFSSAGQTVAISSLLSAIQLADDQPSSTLSDDPTSSGIPTGAIVGGVIGGLVVFTGIIVGIVLLRR